jgi:DNA processing protein
MNQLQYQIGLMLVPQIGAITAKTLVSYCGSAEAVFRASKKELHKIPGIGPSTIAALSEKTEPLLKAERELKFLEQQQVQAIFYTDTGYPARLRQCQDSPAMIFFKGSSQTLFDLPKVLAIVGTRQPSEHGKAICEEIIEGLKPYNVLIVSGLAFGVDVTAHRKATALGIPNVGVLGHGLGSIYPSQHKSVAQRMVENGGLLSEYTHDAKPDREHFPMRNRIISGLSDAVLVVETAESGGSMITVQFAERQGREIFAIPGRPHDVKSIGCNLLFKTERARLAESASDIAQRMQWELHGQARPIQARLFHDLLPEEATIVDIIRDKPEIPIDQLSFVAQFAPGALASHILNLEFKGIIRTLPGKRYIVSG